MFREIRNNNMVEMNLINSGFDPDKRVVPTEVIVEEEIRRQNESKRFDPDKRVNWD